MHGIPAGTTTSSQSEPGSNGNEEVLKLPRSGASISTEF